MRPGVVALVLVLAGCSVDAEVTTPDTATTTTRIQAITMVGETGSTEVVQPTSVGDLLVVGDFGSAAPAEYAVAAAMRSWAGTHNVAAVLTTGDDLYTDNVSAAWTRPFGWISDMGIPLWFTWGNHDHDRPDVVNEAFHNPPRWTAHTWGAVTVVILDSLDISNAEQARWLTSILAWIRGPTIVAEHHPPFSCSRHGDSLDVQTSWVPIFESADVDVVLSGHEHNYQRFVVNGVEYVTSGGGGQTLYALEACSEGHPPIVAGLVNYEFLAISQDLHGLHVQAVLFDGTIADSFDVGWADG
jgi:predicted phosphodiesterase